MLKNMRVVSKEELVLEEWVTLLGHYLQKEKVGMGLACTELRLSLSKGRHVVHLQWDSMLKRQILWDTLYGGWLLGMEDTIYSYDR